MEVEMGDNSFEEPSFNYSLLHLNEVFTDNFTWEQDQLFSLNEKTPPDTPLDSKGFAVQIGISTISIIVNLRVFGFAVINLNQTWSSIAVLMTHHLAFTIISGVYDVIYLAVKSKMLVVPLFCGVWSFVANSLRALIQLSLFVIIIQRLQKAKKDAPSVKHRREGKISLLGFLGILLLWCLAAVVSIPSCFSYTLVEKAGGKGKCLKEIPPKFEIAYWLVRFLILHVFTCIIIAWALYTMRSKLNHKLYLLPIRNRRKRFREHVLRFAYISALVYSALMLPAGLLIMIYNILVAGMFGDEFSPQITWIETLGMTFWYGFCIAHPLIYCGVHEDLKMRKVLKYGWIKLFCVRVIMSKLSENEEEEVEKEEEARKERKVKRVEKVQGKVNIPIFVEAPPYSGPMYDMLFLDTGGNPSGSKSGQVEDEEPKPSTSKACYFKETVVTTHHNNYLVTPV